MNATATENLPVDPMQEAKDRYVIHEVAEGVWSVRDMQSQQWLADADGREDFSRYEDARDLRTEHIYS